MTNPQGQLPQNEQRTPPFKLAGLVLLVVTAIVVVLVSIQFRGGFTPNTKLTLVVAFNYGSRHEIAMAAQRLALEVAEGKRTAESITAEALNQSLDTVGIPDPDLIIRTSGEQRLSNFLMWQAAYSELVFVPIHWPDFDKAALEGAIAEYNRRERRFGGLAAKTGS